jgi:hypothetical protein
MNGALRGLLTVALGSLLLGGSACGSSRAMSDAMTRGAGRTKA